MDIDIRVFRTAELDPYLPALNVLINNAFDSRYESQDRSYYGSEQLFDELRLPGRDQLARELGPGGTVAVAFERVGEGPRPAAAGEDKGAEAGELSVGRRPVAVACAKPWKGRAVALWETQRDESGQIVAELGQGGTLAEGLVREWEVTTCVSVNEPRYRGKGLVGRCLDALVGYLLVAQGRSVEMEDGPLVGRAALGLTLWASVVEGVGNAEYWQRRGFVRVGEPEVAPVGVWGARSAFKIGTLKKEIVG